jgi:hypothetical protein
MLCFVVEGLLVNVDDDLFGQEIPCCYRTLHIAPMSAIWPCHGPGESSPQLYIQFL